MESKMSPNPVQNALDPSARLALGGTSPQRAWDELRALTEHAIEQDFDQSQKLAEQLNLPVDLGDFKENLMEMDPVRGINEFHYINQGLNLNQPLKNPPLKVLEGMLRMVCLSDRYQMSQNLDSTSSG